MTVRLGSDAVAPYPYRRTLTAWAYWATIHASFLGVLTMGSRYIFVVPIIAVLVFGVGCKRKSPCDKLVDAVCASGQSEECANIKRQAEKADEAVNKVCAQILELQPDRSTPAVGCDLLADMVCAERPLEDCLNIRREAKGADLKKAVVCDKFRQMIVDTRKLNQTAQADAAKSGQKAPAARLAPATNVGQVDGQCGAAASPQVAPQEPSQAPAVQAEPATTAPAPAAPATSAE